MDFKFLFRLYSLIFSNCNLTNERVDKIKRTIKLTNEGYLPITSGDIYRQQNHQSFLHIGTT